VPLSIHNLFWHAWNIFQNWPHFWPQKKIPTELKKHKLSRIHFLTITQENRNLTIKGEPPENLVSWEFKIKLPNIFG
jgi:hypothetical protein